MREVDINEAAGSLAELVDGMAAGEAVVLTREGRSVAKLSAMPKGRKIRLGLGRGRFKVPDDFDAPLPDDVLALFYDGPLFPDETERQGLDRTEAEKRGPAPER